jgi:hypothetical protein
VRALNDLLAKGFDGICNPAQHRTTVSTARLPQNGYCRSRQVGSSRDLYFSRSSEFPRQYFTSRWVPGPEPCFSSLRFSKTDQ